MERNLSLIILFGLILPVNVFPYCVQKEGIRVTAVDYARSPEELCIQPDVSESIAQHIGNGIPAQYFLNADWRPVGVTITNTTSKPVMLASSYGKKIVYGDLSGVISQMYPAYILPLGVVAEVSAITALFLFGYGLATNRVREVVTAYMISGISCAVFLTSLGLAMYGSSRYGEFAVAVEKKFDEIKCNEESLILPGQTISKLFLCKKDEYISRFPLVIYSIENREEAIVFNVDLRA